MGGLSIWHWLIVLVVIMVLFGSNRVGNLMGELGKGVKAFKQNIAEDDSKGGKDAARDAAMSPPGSLNAPLPDQTKTTINQG